jgi:hypothetical protein
MHHYHHCHIALALKFALVFGAGLLAARQETAHGHPVPVIVLHAPPIR